MSDERPYHRLSLAEAAERAKDLAIKFLASQTLDWQGEVIHAYPTEKRKPDGRKVGRHWRAIVKWSNGRSAIDGGPLLDVDLETGEVRFSE